MNNRLRTPLEEDEAESVFEQKTVKEESENFITQFFPRGKFDAEVATGALPFIFFLAALGMLYIANRNYAEKNIRDIDKINKEVKELNYDYKTTKAELAFKSTLTEVAKKADTLGIKESLEPPQKITIEEDTPNDN